MTKGKIKSTIRVGSRSGAVEVGAILTGWLALSVADASSNWPCFRFRIRPQGLLTTASDELGIGPFSAVGFASASPRVFKSRAFARASGVNNPAIQNAPPLRPSAPGRRRGRSKWPPCGTGDLMLCCFASTSRRRSTGSQKRPTHRGLRGRAASRKTAEYRAQHRPRREGRSTSRTDQISRSQGRR